MIRRWVVGVAVVACAGALGGCVSIQAVSWEQQDVVGKVRVTVTVCASGFVDGPGGDEDHPGCPDMGNSSQPALSGTSQLLVGLRIPVGVTAPAVVTATPAPSPPAAGTIVLRRSASYEEALTAGAPPAGGMRWVGYLSDPYAFDDGADGVPAQSVPIQVDLGLPVSRDGAPYVGPMPVRPVVGVRSVSSTLPASRPIDCGPNVYAASPPFLFPTSFPQIVCIDSPIPGQVGGSFNVPTRDFGIAAGSATASPGQTVSIPFGVRGAGALPAGLTASLSAATDLPGASVTASQASATLANGSDTRVTAAVAIPRSAGPGTFEVTLTGKLENGQTRVGLAKLTVRDRQPPRLTGAKIAPRKLRPATKRRPRRGATVSFSLSEPAAVVARVQRCARFARGRGGKPTRRCLRYRTLRGRLTHAGTTGANRLRFDGRLRGKALKPGSYRLTLVATDAAANRAAPVRVRFTVPRR